MISRNEILKRAMSLLPKGAEFIKVEQAPPREHMVNTTQMYYAIYKYKSEIYRTTFSGQKGGHHK